MSHPLFFLSRYFSYPLEFVVSFIFILHAFLLVTSILTLIFTIFMMDYYNINMHIFNSLFLLHATMLSIEVILILFNLICLLFDKEEIRICMQMHF